MLATSISGEVALAEGLTREFLVHHRVCPLRLAGDRLVVAAAPDALLEALDDVGFAYRLPVEVEPTPSGEVERLIERIATRTERSIELAQASSGDDLATDVRDLANQPPVIRYVNLLVRDAYDAGASDTRSPSSSCSAPSPPATASGIRWCSTRMSEHS